MDHSQKVWVYRWAITWLQLRGVLLKPRLSKGSRRPNIGLACRWMRANTQSFCPYFCLVIVNLKKDIKVYNLDNYYQV